MQIYLPPIGGVTGIVPSPVTVYGPSPYSFYASGGGLGSSSPGPTYSMASFNMAKCESQLAGVIAAAWSMAQYIAQNASKYSSAVVNSANQAIKQWSGTTMGISASAAFVFGLMASLSVGEWLALGVAVGLTAFTLYIAFNCLANGIEA